MDPFLLNSKEYKWLKNSDFFDSLDLDDVDIIDVPYCSYQEEDVNIYLNVGMFWGVREYPYEFWVLVINKSPLEKCKSLFQVTHS